MAERTAVRVEVRRTIRADRERVFDAWVREEVIREWWPPASYRPGRIAVDARPGGRYELGLIRESDGEELGAVGEYRKVERPSRLEFTWSWTNAPLDTRVVVDFHEVEGGTEVVITHTGFPSEKARDEHEEGWTACLERMAGVLG